MSQSAASSRSADTFLHDVLEGLARDEKQLPCKYFYDEHGSMLFDRICELDEYYLTRTELGIMKKYAADIAWQIDEQVMLVEYGSGSSLKTRVLLDALTRPTAYAPVDISEEHLLGTAEKLREAYPDIEILPVVADFTNHFELPTARGIVSHVATYFPGSTIGNFTEQEAGTLLESMTRILGKDGGLLIGIDLQKDPAIIEAAYNDREGITQEFNLNILARINSELGANFDLSQFRHQAVYDDHAHRVEISIVSDCDQQVTVSGQDILFRKEEPILTEYSHKYTVDGFASMAANYGFGLHEYWTDDRQYFAVLHLVLEKDN